jgi:hypothetical protein
MADVDGWGDAGKTGEANNGGIHAFALLYSGARCVVNTPSDREINGLRRPSLANRFSRCSVLQT